MFEWYMKKLNEFIQVAHYCRHPVIEAHLVLARSATQEYLGEGDPQAGKALENVIRLSAEKALKDGNGETAAKLFEALAALEGEQKKSAEIVTLNFAALKRDTA